MIVLAKVLFFSCQGFVIFLPRSGVFLAKGFFFSNCFFFLQRFVLFVLCKEVVFSFFRMEVVLSFSARGCTFSLQGVEFFFLCKGFCFFFARGSVFFCYKGLWFLLQGVVCFFWTRPDDRRCMSVRTRTHHGRKQNKKTDAVKRLSQGTTSRIKIPLKICTATPNKTTRESTHHSNLLKQRLPLKFQISSASNWQEQISMHPETQLTHNRATQRQN